MKMCEFLWDLTYNRRLKPYSDMPALRFGSLAHKALADWYPKGTKRGTHPAKAFAKHYKRDQQENEEIFGMRLDDEDRWVDAHDLGIAMLNNYVDEYGTDPEWEVLATEMPFQVQVLHPRTGKPWFIYTGVVDGVWRHRRTHQIWVPDHKTTRGIGGTVEHPKIPPHLQMDDQAGSYWSFGVQYLLVKGFLKKNQQLNGMYYNMLRKALPDERESKLVNGKRLYCNLDGSISKRQPSPYFARFQILRDEFDRGMAVQRALVDFERIEKFRSGELEITKSPGMFTCPYCPMRDACELHETGHDWETFLAQTTKPWDPYAEHEVYDGR